MAGPDYSGVTAGINKGYDAQRQAAQQQEGANLQGQRDALARRAAAMGGGPGGAFVQAEQQEGDKSAQRLQGANAQIDQQQAAENRNLQMTKLGQEYQTSERQAGEQFASGQQQSSQQFQAGQQQSQITAQQIMQDKGITAQSSLQDKQIAAQEIMQKTGLDAQSAMQAVQIQAQKDLQKGQQDFQKPFMEAQETGIYNGQQTEQAQVDQFNEKIAQQMADKKDLLENFFGNFSSGNMSNVFGGLTSQDPPSIGPVSSWNLDPHDAFGY